MIWQTTYGQLQSFPPRYNLRQRTHISVNNGYANDIAGIIYWQLTIFHRRDHGIPTLYSEQHYWRVERDMWSQFLVNSYNKYYNKHCIDETTGYQYAILHNLFWVGSIRANIAVLYRAASHFDYCLIAYLLHCCCIVRLSRLYIRSLPRGFEIARYAISRDNSPNRQQPHCQRRT